MPASMIPAFVLAVVLAPPIPAASSEAREPEPPKLLGQFAAARLEEEPFVEWFRPGHDDYAPNPDVVDELLRVGHRGISVSVFMGTWCGDSRREVPRLLKLFEGLGFDPQGIRLIAVDDTDEAHKRSPGGEELGLEIYRVPTAVVARDGVEIGRIVEHPVQSLERDLLAILSGSPYRPSYLSYPVIRRWLGEGLLADTNVSPRGLADEVRSRIASEGELAAAARVMLTRGQLAESVKLYQVNCVLHPDSAACQARLSGALLRAGRHEEARAAAETALRLNTDADSVAELLELLARTQDGEMPQQASRE